MNASEFIMYKHDTIIPNLVWVTDKFPFISATEVY